MAKKIGPLFNSFRKKHGNPRAVLRVCAFSVFLLVQMSAACASASAHCSADEFMCADGSCILQEKMCDGRLDCPDSSDEVDCDLKLCRKPTWFQCSSLRGPCLNAELICNGIENCPGGEDELDCVGSTHAGGPSKFASSLDVGTGGWHSSKRNCSTFEYTCEADKACIPLDFMCDGKRDCHDDSDEVAGCLKAEASCQGFFCSNKKCLESQKWICDGVDDCGDGSDERNCAWNCTPEMNKFLCRNNLACLELSKVCDGRSDCIDGSDESALCASITDNCKTKVCPPASKCQMLPASGPECVCPVGYRYSTLQNACVDINECLEKYGVCSQGCENTAGGYKCTCGKNFVLRNDNKTCQAHGEDALLLYSTQVTIMGVHLSPKQVYVYTVAKNLTKVIGVSYDGDNIYWTNIQNEEESIVKARADGSHHEVLLTSGLDAPEDLAVDWLTGNIYFSDNVMRHIAVCSNDGMYCTVLVSIDVHQPRGVALWPQRGQIFWTDWGLKPMIARASMDGSHSLPIVTDKIHWPNGIALDTYNNRIYWVDAKISTMESVRPDGTDRRIVLNEILKHPYGLAVFEENIYWSDWGTKSIHVCDKFTGKHHKVIAKDRTIYAVHIYHSALQPKTNHPCMNNRCSHLCLLAQNNGSTCACPDGMQLAIDQLRCVKTHKKQRLFMGIKNTLLEMEHTTFGRHKISQTHHLQIYISEMAYNSVNASIFVADNVQRAIFEYDMDNNQINNLVRGNLGNVTGLAFDYLAHNLYWTDSERHVVEVLSLQTRQRAIVNFFSGIEVPIGLAIMPEDGHMFIALRSRRHVHIDKKQLNGEGDHMHVFEDELGDDDIKFVTDYGTKTLYWSDSDLGRISFTDYENLKAYTFRGRLRRPYSVAIVDDDLFWSKLGSATIHWTHKSNLGPLKHVDIEVNKDVYSHALLPTKIPLLASTMAMRMEHPCQRGNAGCSHVCVTMGQKRAACLCPPGLVFKDATNRTCIESLDCEFRCDSGECLTNSRRCNGRKDCPDGSDEFGCDTKNKKRLKVVCGISEFMCHDAMQCVTNDKRCNGAKDCHDGSDEQQCDKFDQSKKCHRHQHSCDNGNCVDFSAMCDGVDDCGDNSDETNCKVTDGKDMKTRLMCDNDMFQCNSGTCIAKSWECDGKLDCTDGSDEHEKCELKDCPDNTHKCMLGQCLDLRLVCDGHNDCGDFSDELNCDYVTGNTRQLNCGDANHPMYQCPSNASVCLELVAKCNGTAECPRGEDEADCGAICSIYEFQCKTSKECIRKEFRCDLEKDCADGSDEFNCDSNVGSNHTTGNSHERPCEPDMFDCKDGQCVDMTRVCDDFGDCDNGADEGPLCKMACKSKPMCTHKCRPTPSGAVCSCFQGYRLDADQRSCFDVNECEEMDPCAQICENTHGSYRCSCYPDFMLRPDKTSCKSIESNSSLMFSTFNEVRSMTEQPIVLRMVWTTNDSRINGFDVNGHQRSAYFTTENEDVLYKVELATGEIKAALTVEIPSKVAVDWITDNVYVISRSQRYGIEICSFAAKMCGRIIQANPRESMIALAVDAFNRHLFYVNIRSQSFNLPFSQINIAELDGSRREMLHAKSGAYITAISVDPYKKLLYYLDSHTKMLQAINYNRGASRNPITIIQKGNAIMRPSGLTVYENQAFIVNIGAKEAVRCHLYGARDCKAFNLNILNAQDIIVDGATRQPLNTNPCIMAKCAGMCVQAEYGYECMCGDTVVTENTKCPKELSKHISSSALLKQAQAYASDGNNGGDAGDSHTATVITLSILLVAAVLIGLGYTYYRRLRQGHRDFNINLHFQNPLSSLAAGKGSANANGNGSAGTTTALSSFEAEREKMQFSAPIYRFLRGSTSSAGSEILLETARAPQQINTLGQFERMPSIVVEDDADNDTAGTNGHYDDDPHGRLVP